jgi:hypothetical protein
MRIEADSIYCRFDTRVEELDHEHEQHRCEQEYTFRRGYVYQTRYRQQKRRECDFLAERALVMECEAQSRKRIEQRIEQPLQTTLTLVRALKQLGRGH